MIQSAHALGLGVIKVRSNLGQALLAQAEILGDEADQINASCWRARVVGMDGILLANVTITLQQTQNQRSISFSSKQAINEPAVVLMIDIHCETQLHREFSILLDPVDTTAFQSTNNFSNTVQTNIDSAIHKAESAATTPRTTANVGKKAIFHSGDGEPQKVPHAKPSEQAHAESKTPSEYADKPRHASPMPSRRARGDILKLSDEVILPGPNSSSTVGAEVGVNARTGLRMSDVLSSQTGQALLGNMQELRAAQARMAAILRDEPASGTVPSEKPSAESELFRLKQEAEKLKKQNSLDKASLEDLQKKTGLDFWLAVLAIIAISLSAIIVMLLVYIQRRAVPTQTSWWEDDPMTVRPSDAMRVANAIDQAQASYEKVDADANASFPEGEPFAKKDKFQAPNVNQTTSSGKKDVMSSTLNDATMDSGLHRTPSLEETNSSIFNFYSPRGGALKVEEISDVTQEAEFWISMNDPQRAIEILSAQEQVDHPDSPVPWLFLLDLYRTTVNAERYNQLRERFIAFFNANIPAFDDDLTHIQFRHLEDFGHVLEIVCDKWGSRDVILYLQSLLIDDREGKRIGFDLPVYRDILMLLGVARELAKENALDAPMLDIDLSIDSLTTDSTDPVDEAQFGSIDFDSIDFPEVDTVKKINEQ